MESVTSRGLQEIFMSCQLSKHLCSIPLKHLCSIPLIGIMSISYETIGSNFKWPFVAAKWSEFSHFFQDFKFLNHFESLNAFLYLSGNNWNYFLVDFSNGGKFRFRQKKFWPRNRYRNLILVSVADTETRFRSYTRGKGSKLPKHDLLPILSCRTRNSATQNPSAPATARNLLFWWSQLASATATLSNFSFNFYSIIS